jgi:hypothetical protein
MAKNDVISEQSSKLLAFYNETNQQAKQDLDVLRRCNLALSSAVAFASGTPIPITQKDSFIQICSIFYSEKTPSDKVVSQLMTAMRTWIVSQYFDNQSVAFLLKGDGEKIGLYVASTEDNVSRDTFEASFPGMVFGKNIKNESIVENMSYGGVFTGIPAYSDKDQEQLYSLDNVIRGLRSKKFVLLICGISLSQQDILKELDEVRKQIGNNHDRIKQNLTRQFGEGVTHTLGTSITTFGALMKSLSNAHSVANTVTNTHSETGSAIVYSAADSESVGKTVSDSVANTAGNTLGSAVGLNYSISKNKNKSISDSLEKINQFASAYEEALSEREQRLSSAVAEGAWKATTYILTEDFGTLKLASSLFKSCLTSHFDVFEPFRFIRLTNDYTDWENCLHSIPLVTINGKPVELSTLLTSSEFAALMSLPEESCPGIDVKDTPRFEVNLPLASDSSITFGNICDREVKLCNQFALSKDDLRAHTLVAGLTGMGKSTTIREILSQCNLPFLVIEPAKSEYRNLIIDGREIRVFTAGDEDTVPLHLNPFEIPIGENLHGHIDSLTSILNGAFPMEGPMAALVEQGLVRAYKDAGWDDFTGQAPNDQKIPTMDTFYSALAATIEEQKFQGDYGCNIKSALLTRINSLRIGPRGRLFNNENTFDVADLLSTPTVIEMKKLGNDETKAFLTGLILLRVYKYLEYHGNKENLERLLVLEEAHRIFRRSEGKNNSLVGNNTAQQTVEMFENIMAEVRAYGLGIIIAEQLPLRLSDGAIKNTNLKIIHRLAARDDATEMGGSMGLSPEKSAFINRLNRGEALIHCSSLNEPVHVKVLKKIKNTDIVRTDEDLRRSTPRLKASEKRPAYFENVRSSIEDKSPRSLEILSDQCFFSILMIPWSKSEKWNYIWNECITHKMYELSNLAGIEIDVNMGAHLLHSAILGLIKSKKYLLSSNPALALEIAGEWDTALTDPLHLNLDKIRSMREKLLSSEVFTHFIVPNWLPKDYPSLQKLYPEAKQMAAAMKEAYEKDIIKMLQAENLTKFANMIVTAICQRTIQNVDVRGETMTQFAFAVAIALLNWLRPAHSTDVQYLAKLEDKISKQFANGGR